MSRLAFISYRRDDTGQIAQSLYLQLKEAFGSGQLFMDAHSIRKGEAWPDRVRRKLEGATILLALIGPGWLFARDQYGRRRIDDPTDWVRNEILEALRRGIAIIPIVIDDLENLPPEEGLPEELKPLATRQATVLRTAAGEWSTGVTELRDLLASQHRLVIQPLPAQPLPDPKKSETPVLNDDELAAALETLPGWDPWIDSLPQEWPQERHELRKTFAFKNFREAMKFMDFLVDVFQKAKHHPRWENGWNVVRIRLTTWDVGNKITHFDVDTAHAVEAAHREFKRGRR